MLNRAQHATMLRVPALPRQTCPLRAISGAATICKAGGGLTLLVALGTWRIEELLQEN
jgi:hypothetical protein